MTFVSVQQSTGNRIAFQRYRVDHEGEVRERTSIGSLADVGIRSPTPIFFGACFEILYSQRHVPALRSSCEKKSMITQEEQE